MTIDTMTPLLEINAGDTAWVLASASLVLFMTPMLAFFYGGMVRAKGVLNMLMMNVVAMGTIGVLWVVCGYSMAFGDPPWGSLIGNPAQYFGLHGVMGTEVGTIPGFVFVAFQSAFAIIATALISGAVADRMKFSAWVVFTILWGLLVYFPAANWVFGTGWILNTMHAVDFAGGTAIHINAGCRPCPGPHPRPTRRIWFQADASAQHHPRHARCRRPVVRLVRIQRRICAGGQ